MVISSPRAGANAYQAPLLTSSNLPEQVRQNAEVLTGVMNGKINSTGTVTLAANQTTTVIIDQRIGPNSVILLMPTTANAAAAAWHVSSRGEKTATLTHGNNAQTDRSYAYVVFG